MKQAHKKIALCLMVGVSSLALAMPSLAQAQDKSAQDKSEGTEIVITGVARAVNKIDTSVSVSAIDIKSIQNNVVRGTTEVLRSLPGVRAEASAGGGNSNIGVRGIPVSTGGQKWVQIQEDGLPVQLFGDSNFNAPDAYYKIDSNLARVEAVRGGTASTLTTNGPGAIINFISQNGKKDGGSLSLETGVDHKDFKIDGGFGGRLADDLYYYVGGHYQTGGDYRKLGYNGVEGGQIRASLTKEFGDKSFLRVWVKGIDKKDATYMPQPMTITGGTATVLNALTAPGAGGTIGKPVSQANNSPYLNQFISLDSGKVLNRNGAAGIHVKSLSFGGEFNGDAGNGWVINDKFKYAKISGDFLAPFTDVIFDGSQIAARYGVGVTAAYFNGPHAGQVVNAANLQANNGNSLLQEIAQFDTEMKDAGNFVNDLKLSNSWSGEGYDFDLTLGYFHMSQQFKQSWHWQQFLTDVGTDTALISLSNGATQGGQLGYNKGFNWNGNNRQYDLTHTADAPYVSATVKMGDLTLDGSLRRDQMREQGIVTNAIGGNVDVNGDGVISPAETGVSINQGPGTNSNRVNFTVSHNAYSFGANYKLVPGLAIFGRISEGASFNSERQYGNDAAHSSTSGALTAAGSEFFVDVVKQYEIGVKWQTKSFLPGRIDLASTYFNAETEESQTNTTQVPPVPYSIKYESKGIESEIIWRVDRFTLNGTATYTDAKIVSNTISATQVGKRPRRQAEWIYNLNVDYSTDMFDVGANVYGTSDSYAGFENYFVQKGYAVVSAYVNYHMSPKLTLSLNANNLFNSYGVTEAEEDAGRAFKIGTGQTTFNYISARPIGGRTVSMRLKYVF